MVGVVRVVNAIRMAVILFFHLVVLKGRLLNKESWSWLRPLELGLEPPNDANADAAGDGAGEGDGGSSEYMQVPTYNPDDDADNVYLSLLDIVSIEERQIQEVGNTPHILVYINSNYYQIY